VDLELPGLTDTLAFSGYVFATSKLITPLEFGEPLLLYAMTSALCHPE